MEKVMFSFPGKRALVTGAGKGIGRALAEKLADCGAEVTAISRTQSDLDELQSKYGEKIKPVLLDVGNWSETKSALEKLCSGGSVFDFLVNNAGIYKSLLFGEISEEGIDEVFNINLKAVVNISQVVAAGMKERGTGGSIVNVTSISSEKTSPTSLLYGSSKAALDQLTRNMAHELGSNNIRVNAVSPGPTRTAMTEILFTQHKEAMEMMRQRTHLLKLGEVDEVTEPILFLLSDSARHITGAILKIDGGLSNTF